MTKSAKCAGHNLFVALSVCMVVIACGLVTGVLSGCAGDDEQTKSTSESSASVSANASSSSDSNWQGDDFVGTPTNLRELQHTPDFKRTQQLSLQIHKGMTFAEVAAICGEGKWSDNSDGEMKIEGTAGYYTWVDADGKWKILAGFDGKTTDALATGEVFVQPVDEHIYDGLAEC